MKKRSKRLRKRRSWIRSLQTPGNTSRKLTRPPGRPRRRRPRTSRPRIIGSSSLGKLQISDFRFQISTRVILSVVRRGTGVGRTQSKDRRRKAGNIREAGRAGEEPRDSTEWSPETRSPWKEWPLQEEAREEAIDRQ